MRSLSATTSALSVLARSLRILGKEAFSHTGLNGTFTSISFPATLEIIREGVFTDCRFLSSVTFQGSKVTEIGEEAFWNCIALKSIVLPGSLKSVGTDAFSNCDSLHEVTFQSGNGNTVIATKCFDNVKSLTLLNFQDQVWRVSARTRSSAATYSGSRCRLRCIP